MKISHLNRSFKNREFTIKSSLAVISLLSAGLSGCGNLMMPMGVTVPGSTYALSGTYTGQAPTTADTNPQNYSCPSSPNITPQNGSSAANNFNFYRLCPDKISSSSTHFMLSETSLNPSVNQSVCVFAANQQILASNLPSPQVRVAWELEPGNANTPLYRCTNLGMSSAFLVFPSTGLEVQWNAAYIVAQENAASMVACLKSNLLNCPPYSYGAF